MLAPTAIPIKPVLVACTCECKVVPPSRVPQSRHLRLLSTATSNRTILPKSPNTRQSKPPLIVHDSFDSDWSVRIVFPSFDVQHADLMMRGMSARRAGERHAHCFLSHQQSSTLHSSWSSCSLPLVQPTHCMARLESFCTNCNL